MCWIGALAENRDRSRWRNRKNPVSRRIKHSRFNRLIPPQLHIHCPRPRPVKLRQIDPLPASQDQLATLNKQGVVTAQQAGFDVGRAVSLGVTEIRALRDDGVKGDPHITPHIGVPIFVEGNGGGGMGAKKMAEATVQATLSHKLGNPVGHVNEFLAFSGANLERFHSFTYNLYAVEYSMP
jgi:hypothetical protein